MTKTVGIHRRRNNSNGAVLSLHLLNKRQSHETVPEKASQVQGRPTPGIDIDRAGRADLQALSRFQQRACGLVLPHRDGDTEGGATMWSVSPLEAAGDRYLVPAGEAQRLILSQERRCFPCASQRASDGAGNA